MRRRTTATVIGLVAVVALTATLMWQVERTATKRAHQEAAVKRSMPIIEAAFEAALSKYAAVSAKAYLYRTQSGSADYRQFITATHGTLPGGQQLGQDFTWRGKRYSWPTNPYAGGPMKQGTAPGDFSIRFKWWGNVSGLPDAFDVIGYGRGGKPVVTLSHSQPLTPVSP